ncbi:MAG: hypothetical protein PGN08_13370 [Sphingomonas taxi]
MTLPAAPLPLVETYGLDAALAADLRRLDEMPTPRVVGKGAWRPIVDDAMRIARDGWAASAMSLGWSEHDLFGIGPHDDWEFAGLAVWLRGRSIVVVDEMRAIVADGDRRAAYSRRRLRDLKPVMLWEFGR